MKKTLLISAFLVATSMMFGQFTIHYSGIVSNLPTTPVMMYLEVDSVIVDSTLAQPSTGGYVDSLNVTTRPFMIRILFTDCNGVQQADWYSPPPALVVFRVSFTTMNYCPSSPCQASFAKFQAIDPVTRLPIPNKAILVDQSIGTGLSYSWNFGDGSPAQTGLNVTHTYATHGSYLVCLTVTGTTTTGFCTSTFCDTLSVDSLGNVRSPFIVNTGSSHASINESQLVNYIKLFPNPARDYTTLDFESMSSTELIIKIIDAKGSELLRINKSTIAGNNRIQLSTIDLEEGMYFIQLLDGNSVVTKRLQIVR